ncbi:hypothetical protein Rhe02_96320 [Rhizocola hellebori]|uniref:Pilus assembly protein TadE n=1 Tax=Rhizocola hellebori TaxID=1392758 RepID=A0A8J3QIN4_9ACTN|nr:hypothetical protein [Rhizocola hellebori]GIH11565.1 hypothetical protein Rhe02_96320 [Rhizocola hellebori]
MSRDRGSVTAELAVSLPALVLLLMVGVLAIAAATTKLGCVSMARDIALSVARGQTPSTMDGAAVRQLDDRVVVTVDRGIASCSATAATEPGVA